VVKIGVKAPQEIKIERGENVRGVEE
jgi:sRNA-binding carbon storage regulator CsrA